MNALPNPWQFTSVLSEPREQTLPTETPAVTDPNPQSGDVTAAFSDDDCIAELVGTAVQYSPEYFSDYARRRSMPLVSPPLQENAELREFEPDFDAMYDFIVPPEPPAPPAFLRKPSAAFMRALFQAAQ